MFLQSLHIAKCVVNRYLCGMALSDNIKAIREEKGLKQIDVASHINVDKSAYSKIEKGSRNVTVEELQGMATLFGMTMDQVVNYEGVIPQEVTIEDKSMVERIKLIEQLNEEDKKTIFSIIDKMLTNKKFKDFFNKNVAAL